MSGSNRVGRSADERYRYNNAPAGPGTRSRYDHGQASSRLAGRALNVRASNERLPWASFRERQVLTMTGHDASPSDTVAGREAARQRLADARATFRTTHLTRSASTWR